MTRKRGEEGVVLVIVALSMVVLIGFIGLAVDVGYVRYVDRQMRSAADAAALGGAEELLYGNNTGGLVGAGKADAAKDGFSDGVNGVEVNIYNPPNSGPHTCANDAAGCNQFVEATISQNQPTFFMKIFNISSVRVSTRAVAWEGASNASCIYALDPAGSNALTVNGSPTAITANCNIMVDSNSSSAYVVSGPASVCASLIGVVGGNTGTSNCPSPPPLTGQPVLGMVPVSDPLSYVQPPTNIGSCPALPPSVPTGCAYTAQNGLTCHSTPSADLQPGTYCNGISIGAKNTTVTFAPGTYVLNGGGLNVSGGANLIGNGVTFYNTVSATTTYEPIAISGGSTLTLTAPTSGSLADILFFQDRNLPPGDLNQQNTISGDSGSVITGALYFPTTPLMIAGGTTLSSVTLSVALVADTITVVGGSNLTFNSLSGQNPIHQVVLVE